MKCKAKTKAGKVCKMQATRDGFCYSHSPGLAAERAESRRRGGQNRRRPRTTPPGEVRLRSLDDVLSALEHALGDAYALDSGASRCRVVVYTCSTALKTIETKALEEIDARLSVLEQNEQGS